MSVGRFSTSTLPPSRTRKSLVSIFMVAFPLWADFHYGPNPLVSASEGLVKPDNRQIQERGEGDPGQVRYQQQARDMGNRQQQHDRRQNRQPQERYFPQCPVGPAQLEEQRAPEDIRDSVQQEQHRDQHPAAGISGAAPREVGRQRGQPQDQRPGRSEQPVGGLPGWFVERAVPGQNIRQKSAAGSHDNPPSSGADDFGHYAEARPSRCARSLKKIRTWAAGLPRVRRLFM